MDVRKETGVETYVNDEPGDPNPGIIVDSAENRGKALTSSQARALAADLISQADYFDSLQVGKLTFESVNLTIYRSPEGAAFVIEIDTQEGTGEVRVYVNEGQVFNGDPETEHPIWRPDR